ncbi:hypothetical protein HY227_00390 [Candidatus Wolfebacteria bacterium]|nr:hypothetical protein [Candidatus Wolfebacteria bacterium]
MAPMLKTLAPSITTRDPKGLKFISIVEAAYNKANLSEEEAQRVNDAHGLAKLVSEFITANRRSNQYADEEVKSSYTYPGEYKGPKPVVDQVKAIAKIFNLDPGQALEFAKNLPALPDGAEGWFAIPSVDALAKKHFPEVTDPAQKYCQAVQLVHAKIAASRSFYNYREGQITPAQLRVHARTAHALDLIAKTQKGDILIVAAQLGMRHRGKSVRRAREVFVANEFGLGSLAVGSIVLTHPERLVRWEELDMDCPGDEFNPDAGGSFDYAPYFDFDVSKVDFGAHRVSGSVGHCGSVSLFLPQ